MCRGSLVKVVKYVAKIPLAPEIPTFYILNGYITRFYPFALFVFNVFVFVVA